LLLKNNNIKQLFNKKREVEAIDELIKLSETIRKTVWITAALKIRENGNNAICTGHLHESQS
jgi:uncharacterized phosphosugar-binding protein